MRTPADDRIEDLERRLTEYHEWLSYSIADRDRLAIDAAWGVHGSLHSIVASVALFYAFDRFVGWDGWILPLALGFAIFAADMAVRMWSNHERMKEVDRFPKLPRWRQHESDE